MAKSKDGLQRHRKWVERLTPEHQGWPVVTGRQPDWAAGFTTFNSDIKVWKRKEELERQQQGQRGQRMGKIGRVRVSFPLKFGIGMGVGGVDSGGLMLRLARLEGGCNVQSDMDSDGVR
jgi:hypothetical protein